MKEIVSYTGESIVDIPVDEGIAIGSGNGNNHANLSNLDLENQHPVKSIVGLEGRLSALEALKTEREESNTVKTIYSKGENFANRYKFITAPSDGYPRIGRFVSFNETTEEVDVCTGLDIFGVTVDDAGFIGNYSADQFDEDYVAVVTSGVVDVICVTDVQKGDCVVSDEYGRAKKAIDGCGYRVIDVNDEGEYKTATIMLSVQADKINRLGRNIEVLTSRTDANETNILTAIHLSSLACAKNGVETDYLKELEDEVREIINESAANSSSAVEIANQAQQAAEDAITSASNFRDEAVSKANEALTENSELRKEYEGKVEEIDSEIKETKDGFDTTISDLRLETEGQLADFQKEVSENYATTIQLAAVKTETSESIAAVKQEASDTYATIESIAAFKTETSESIAGFKQEVTETYATQEMLTSYKNEASEALTLYKTEVSENYATQEMVTTLETNTSQALVDYKQEVTDTYATSASLTNLKTDTTNAIAASEEKATKTYASKSELTSFESDTNVAMARIEQKADANGAYIQSTVSNMDKYSVGPHSQAYGFTLEQAATVLEEGMIYVPTVDHDEEYKYTDAENKTQTYKRSFTRQYLYKWGTVSGEYRWITVDKNYNETSETNTSDKAVYFVTTEPTVGDNFGYWYTEGSSVAEPYKPYTLYKWDAYVDESDATQYQWVQVATLAGNSQSRAVSQVKQTANSIESSVTTLDNKYAGTKTWIDENKSAIQATVTWKNDNAESIATFIQEAGDNFASAAQVAQIVDKDGNIIEASIVTAVNNNASSIYLSADNIVMDGNTTFKGKLEEVENNSVTNSYIEYALSTSSTEFSPVEGADGVWSTTAPQWREGAYMWQRAGFINKNGDKMAPSNPACIQGARGSDGTGVSIKGAAYAKDITDYESAIDTLHYLYSDSACTTQIVSAESGDAYLVNGYLFVYDKDNKFVCSGKIQGVGVTRAFTRYYISDNNNTPDNNATPNLSNNIWGWYDSFDDMFDQYWKLKDQNPSATYYIWSQEKVNYSDGTSSHSVATKDGATSVISMCCRENNETKINGANIATGTITADQIDATNLRVAYADVTGHLDSPSGTIGGFNIGGKCGNTDVTGLWYGDKGQDGSFWLLPTGSFSGLSTTIAGHNRSDWSLMLGTDFGVTKAGNLYANNANITGTITADGGQIGGFTIGGQWGGTSVTGLRYGEKGEDGSFWVLPTGQLGSFGTTIAGNYRTDWSLMLGTDFGVTKSGNLYANNAEITGNITANNGAIGGWKINSGDLCSESNDSQDRPKIYLSPTGREMTVSDLSSSSQNWIMRIGDQFGVTEEGKVFSTFIRVNGYSDYSNLLITRGLEVTYKDEPAACYITNDGLYVINPLNLSEFAIPNNIVFGALKGSVGPDSVSHDDYIGIAILTNGDVDIHPKSGAQISIGNTNDANNILRGTWKLNGSVNITSDRNLKHDIESLEDKYSTLFDDLKPVRFKYNDGMSNRYHTGFIAQDVCDSVVKAELTTNDFAAYVESTNEDNGTIERGLRYDEFISLNTWQIQKLKKRVEELEEKLNKLENKTN